MDFRLIELQKNLYGTAILSSILLLILILTLKFRRRIFYPCMKDITCDAFILTILFYIGCTIAFIACFNHLFDDIFYYCHPDYFLSLGDKK